MRDGYIVAVGDIVADLVVSLPALPIQPDDFQVAHDIETEAGGSANFLITAARLGVEAMAFGSLGEDAWGNRVAAILRDETIDMSNLVVQGTTTLALVLVDQKGEHAFVGKFGEGSAIHLDDHKRRVVESAAAVFCSGYSLREARFTQLTLDSLQAARKAGVPTFFDAGPAFIDLPEDVKRRALKLVDCLLLTEDELAAVTKDWDVGLLALGPKTMVVKKGAAGCVVHTVGGEEIEQPGFSVPVRDTTAAGDSFDAGFVVGSVWGWSLSDCAQLANAVGAAKVQKLGGGRSVPTLEEVRRIIEQFKVDIRL